MKHNDKLARIRPDTLRKIRRAMPHVDTDKQRFDELWKYSLFSFDDWLSKPILRKRNKK